MAFANSITSTASALCTLDAKAGTPNWRELDLLVTEWQPNVIIVGRPCHIDGSESTMTIKAVAFGQSLADRYTLPVSMVDERLTSAQAEQELREQRRTGAKRRKLRKADIDSLAAQLIAETWLAGLANENTKN